MSKIPLRRGDTGVVTGDWTKNPVSYADLTKLCEKQQAELLQLSELSAEIKRLKHELAEEKFRHERTKQELLREKYLNNSNATVDMKIRAATMMRPSEHAAWKLVDGVWKEVKVKK